MLWKCHRIRTTLLAAHETIKNAIELFSLCNYDGFWGVYNRTKSHLNDERNHQKSLVNFPSQHVLFYIQHRRRLPGNFRSLANELQSSIEINFVFIDFTILTHGLIIYGFYYHHLSVLRRFVSCNLKFYWKKE